MKNINLADQNIINTILLNSSFINNLGLLNGKMGISICFYHLARQTGNPIYEDYAGELIDEIYEEIDISTSLDFENGLAGIGWGIEYLVQNNFIEADTNEVLEEFDKRLMPLIYSFPSAIGLCNGLVGLGAYLLKRIQNSNSNNEEIQTLINKQLLVHLISELDRRISEQNVSLIISEPVSICQKERQEKLEKKDCVFDLTWDYPLLLCFLSEVFQVNLYNVKLKSILKRLVVPLMQNENLPDLQSNRLLLAYALVKLGQSVTQLDGLNTENASDNFLNFETDNIVQQLLFGITRNVISKELTPNCAFLKNGTMGLAWVYRELFNLCSKEEYLIEAEYWHTQSFDFDKTDTGYAGFSFENETNAFGLLEGMSGIIYFLIDMKNYELDYNIK